jgi:phosphohistidine swiveling domain-containing protein
MTVKAVVSTIATEPIPPGYWRREVSHAPRPQSPLGRTTALAYSNAGFRRMFDELGVLPETLEWREIRGWIYTRLVPSGGGDRTAAAAETLRTDRYGRYLDRWFRVWHDELTVTIAELRAARLGAMDDTELIAHLRRVLALLERGIDVHFRLQGGYAVLLADLAFTCRSLLGWDDRRTLHLLRGLSTASTEPARRLSELATLARTRPAVRALLRRADAAAAAALAQADPEFAARFAAYQHEFGFRSIRYEVIDPTLAETPELVLRLLRDQLDTGYDPSTADITARDARERCRELARAQLSGVDLARFDRALSRAERIYPVREEYGPTTFSEPLALLRHAALEVGHRLAAVGRLTRAEDAFFLEGDELLAALAGGDDLEPMVVSRRADREWALAHPGPASYGTPGPPPSLRLLPAEARFVNEAMMWLVGHSFAPDDSARVQTGGVLTGLPASSGSYAGPVRVIHGESEFDRLHPGDVLVCPITSPVWSVLFPQVGALVTDTGGILSHPAIIAREYGIPAVVATGNATSVLCDGQLATVDGSAGTVRVTAPIHSSRRHT